MSHATSLVVGQPQARLRSPGRASSHLTAVWGNFGATRRAEFSRDRDRAVRSKCEQSSQNLRSAETDQGDGEDLKSGGLTASACRPRAVLRCYSMELGQRRPLPAVGPALRAADKERVPENALAERRRVEREALRAIGYVECEDWVPPAVGRRGFSDGED